MFDRKKYGLFTVGNCSSMRLTIGLTLKSLRGETQFLMADFESNVLNFQSIYILFYTKFTISKRDTIRKHWSKVF